MTLRARQLRCLVTAIGSLSAESVISSLRKLDVSTIAGTNASPAEWVFCSTLVDEFHQVPAASEQPEFIASLLRICSASRITHLIPLTDPEVDALSAVRDRFEAIGTTLCMPSGPAVEICRDKWLVHEAFVKSAHVRVIPTVRLEDASRLDFPLIAKPAKGRSSEGLIYIAGPKDLENCRHNLGGQDYIVQPHLDGSVYVVDIVRQQSSGRQATTCRRELTRTGNGAGITVHMKTEDALEAMAGTVAAEFDINGCVNIEFMMSGGAAYLMDINPRFSAGVGFSMLAGYDMPRNHLKCFTSSEIDPPAVIVPAILTRRFVEVSTHI